MPAQISVEHEYWHVLVAPRTPDNDAHGRDALGDVHRLGITHITSIESQKLYLLRGRLTRTTVERIAKHLLADAVVQCAIVGEGLANREADMPAIEVHHLPGVMDPTAQSALSAIRDLLSTWNTPDDESLTDVLTARRYLIHGARNVDELVRMAGGVLANDCIERAYIVGFGRSDALPAAFAEPPKQPFELRHASLAGMSDDALMRLSREGHLFLSLEEMQTIAAHFDSLDRDPTDIELQTLAQTWSEHCVHKTLKSEIVYRGDGFVDDQPIERTYNNLLADTIAAVTHRLNHPWCLSVFEDNAGVIGFDDEYGVAFKVETHNHPSAIEPYGGAATGIGGCIRDIMGCGLGAKPIASTDVFCVAPPDWADDRMPRGVLHPRRILKGVVAGVRDYGNRMGIPTVNGAVVFEPRYLANPLVFCGCVGLIPRDRIRKEAKPGDRVVVAGGRTGRDGIHGATFSSAELTDTHADEFSHAVQIGNPIEEKRVLDALLIARDHPSGCLFNAVTDCGAGGLSSAVGEMGEKLGAAVELDRVPLKYAGLRYDEIWISEAQERMVFSVSPDRLDAFLNVFRREEVEATDIGEFTGDGRLVMRFDGAVVGELDMAFLHGGLPKRKLVAQWQRDAIAAVPKQSPRDSDQPIAERLIAEMSSLNVASKEWIIRQYDHQVQSGSVIKPLSGPGSGPSDAAVIRPRLDSHRGIALGCGLAPHVSDDDPYRMAIESVDEALRNVVCVGGNPHRTAVLDNFAWGGVQNARALGSLVRACQGTHDAALAYGLPFISGKDSLNNQFSQDPAEAERLNMPATVSIPGTLLISAISIIDDVRHCVTMDLKQPGNRLVLLRPDRPGELSSMFAVHRVVAKAIAGGRVRAAHDVSDGGIAVAIAEMCIAGDLGADVDLASLPTDVDVFLATPATYCIAIDADQSIDGAIELGCVTDTQRLIVRRAADELCNIDVARLREAWQAPLRDGPGGR